MKIGVTAPGSAHAFVSHLLASVGLSPDDVSIIGVGRVRCGSGDAGRTPRRDRQHRTHHHAAGKFGTIQVMVETVTVQGAKAAFGSPCRRDRCTRAVRRVQSADLTLTNAMVRALRWLNTASAEGSEHRAA
jgi:hypothetical protein